MRNATGLKVRTIAILSTISVAILLLTSLFPLVYAAVPWTKDPGELSLKEGVIDELFAIDSWVIKNSDTDYEMWYTHSRADMGISELSGNITAILSDNLISALIDMDLAGLLAEMAAIDATNLWNFMTATTTVIGYATSTDGIDWDIVDDEVLAGATDEWENFGAPCVIKDGGTYEMWFTHSDTALDQTSLATYLDDLDDPTAATVRDAMIALINSTTSSAIGYATSSDGIDWGTPTPGVFGDSGGGVWDSVATPCVIKNGTDDYEMWYTYADTSLTTDDLDTILHPDNIGDFDSGDLWNILGNINSVIGYATYDGLDWTIVNPSVVSGVSGGLWDSVATPCVIKNSGVYEIWYSSFTTDLDSTDFGNLFTDLQTIGPDILSLWGSFASGDLNTFITDFDAFFGVLGPFDSIRPYLDDTATRISYATSLDGIDWTTQNPAALVGDSGSPWSSVASPCVVWEDGVYEMWFTQGVEFLTAQNIVSILDGTNLPIGYATGFNLVAETSASPGIYNDGVNDIAAVDVNIDRGKDSFTGLQADIPGGVSSFTAVVTGDHLGIEILEVIGVSPFDSPVFDLNDYLSTGSFTISCTASSPIQPSNTTVARIIARLIGDAETDYDLTIKFQSIMANDPPVMNVSEENPNTLIFRRGDANKDGIVDIADAMSIAQYVVGLIGLNDINAINAGCVAHDFTGGDIVDIADAMFIAQHTVFIRDDYFE